MWNNSKTKNNFFTYLFYANYVQFYENPNSNCDLYFTITLSFIKIQKHRYFIEYFSYNKMPSAGKLEDTDDTT